MNFKNYPKEIIVIKIMAIFWIITKLISYKVWLSNRLFPVIPPFQFLENVPNWVHLILFLTAILGLSQVFFYPKNKFILLITFGVELFSCLLDQNRWQPYEYQFLLMLLIYTIYKNNPKKTINYWIFLLAIIYFQSGLHKCNGSFLYSVWEKTILKQFLGYHSRIIQSDFLHYFGLLISFFEIFLGLGLLFLKNKRLIAYLLIAMHFFILIILSPIGINHNLIVLPWNFALIIMLYLLFCHDIYQPFSIKKMINPFGIFLFLLLGIAPFFSFFGWFDNYLSFNLYSDSPKKAEICINNPIVFKGYKKFMQNSKYCNCSQSIFINNWALKELNITVYPEERIYKSIFKDFKNKYPSQKIQFILYQYPYKKQELISQ